MAEDLGREFVDAGLVTEEQLKSALEYHGDIGGEISDILVKLGHAKESDLLTHIAKREGLEVVAADDVKVDEEIMARLPRELVEKRQLVPLSHTLTHLKLAMQNASDLSAIEEVRFLTGLEVQTVLVSSKAATRAIGRYYEKSEPAPARPRQKRNIHDLAREVGSIPTAADASRSVAEIETSPAKLIRALAALLVDRKVISADDLRAWVRRLEQ